MEIDEQLAACGWAVQDYKHAAVAAAQGVAVREVPTDTVRHTRETTPSLRVAHVGSGVVDGSGP